MSRFAINIFETARWFGVCGGMILFGATAYSDNLPSEMLFLLTKPQQKEIVVRRSIPLEVWRYEPAYELESVSKRIEFATPEATLAAWVTGLTIDDTALIRAAVSDTRWEFQQAKTTQDLELDRMMLDMAIRGKRLVLEFKIKLGERVLIRMTSYEPATNAILTRFWYVLALEDREWRHTLPEGDFEQALVARFDPESPTLTISRGYKLMTVEPTVAIQ